MNTQNKKYLLIKPNNKQYIDILIDYLPSNIECRYKLNGIDSDKDTVIIINIDLFEIALLLNFKNIYYFNIEQLSIYKDYLNGNELSFVARRVFKNILNKYNKLDKQYYDKNRYKLLDYSYENKDIWETKMSRPITGIIQPFYPLQSNINKNDKLIDMITLVNSEYRVSIINNYLPNIKNNIKNFNGLFTNNRRELLKGTKILVNIHSDKQYIIGESFRIHEALSHKVIIISQNVYNKDLLTFGDFIIFVDDNELEAKCLDVLENYDEYYAKYFEGDNLFRLKKLTSVIQDNNNNVFNNLD